MGVAVDLVDDVSISRAGIDEAGRIDGSSLVIRAYPGVWVRPVGAQDVPGAGNADAVAVAVWHLPGEVHDVAAIIEFSDIRGPGVAAACPRAVRERVVVQQVPLPETIVCVCHLDRPAVAFGCEGIPPTIPAPDH